MPSTPTFAVGIDLGTTHCAVASARLDRPTLRLMAIPQLVALGEVTDKPLLPSFVYLPASGELSNQDLGLPWGTATNVVGQLARRLGAKVPNRLVASAKSWVCHGGVNRRAPILPWSAPDTEPHISPFEAQATYLGHLRQAWNAAHPDAPLHEQDVVVTVPASFDEGAREITTAAAEQAGLGNVRLLEEPQAAFYDFLGTHSDDLGEQLGDARLILVIDVGGGTTDLTLLRVNEGHRGLDDGEPRIERIAVGGHLMLGGDNMDAALASYALTKAGLERTEDATIWSALVQSATEAKELLLGPDAPAQAVISYQARGSRLIGGTRSITIEREEITKVLLDGFFPRTAPDEVAPRSARAGLTTLGLPYTSDAAIPRHVCAFLRRHVEAAAEAGAQIIDGLPRPDLVLLNGGVFNGPAMIERLSEVLTGWYGKPVKLLEHTSLDTAVAHGAARSVLARRGLGEVIGGGTARAYYIGIEGRDGSQAALCIAPRAMEEATTVAVPQRVFDLVLDQPVVFPLYTYTGDRVDPAGEVIDVGDELDPLPPLQTLIRDKAGGTDRQATVAVTLSATLTETGALELYLTTVELPPRRWRLELALRVDAPPQPQEQPTSNAAAKTGAEQPAPEVLVARGTFAAVFAGSDAKALKGLRRDIEKTLGPRGQWSAATCRAVWDMCLAHRDGRGNSEAHEVSWLRLCGWGLRPGFGVSGDDKRLEVMWDIRREGLIHRKKASWSEWWILWRRIAAGLDAQRQHALFEDVQPWLWRTEKPPAGPHKHGLVEMIQMLGALERLPPRTKQAAGDLILQRIDKVRSYWPLGRVGTRVPFHGEAADVVARGVASGWLHRLLELNWDTAEGAAFAAATLARLSGDPQRDIEEPLRKQVAQRLTKAQAPAGWVDMVLRATDLSAGDLKRMFGESLPAGLRLK